jgi:hypothetical protein
MDKSRRPRPKLTVGPLGEDKKARDQAMFDQWLKEALDG